MRARLGAIPWLVVWSLAVPGCEGTIGSGGSGAFLAPDPGAPSERGESSVEEDALDEDGAGEGERSAYDFTAESMLDAEELAFLKRLNEYRASKGKGKLRVSIALTRASAYHSRDMATQGYFSHTSLDGTAWSDRIKRFYSHNTYLGENLAKGYATGDSVFAGWKASSGHNANMLGADFTVLGIARVADGSGVYYWTTDFGGYKDAILSAGLSTLLSNAGFESSSVTSGVAWSSARTLGRWHLHGTSGGSAVRRTAAAYNGSYGLRSTDTSTGYASSTQLVRAAAGVNYALSASVRRVSGGATQLLYLDFLDRDFKRVQVFTVRTPGSSTWGSVAVSATSPARTAYVRAILYGATGATEASVHDWDGVRLEAF